MPLKLKKSQTPSESINKKDETEGPWGRINPESESVIALRFCKKKSASTEETYSYPYRVLSSWRWRGGAGEEELQIEAGSDLVTIKGLGLDRLVEALDRGLVEILCETRDDRPSNRDTSIRVLEIKIEKSLS